ATGMSITLGYHRMMSHQSFKAAWPVRFGTLVFGAAAFQQSALLWASEHRRHHKFVDHDKDPYDITRGFFHAHIGWLLFQEQPDEPTDNVKDLRRDALVMWQHRNYLPIAFAASFGLPALLGGLHGGWVGALGGFLLAGVTRLALVHHSTFFINSLCHTLGRQPYSSRCSARDSAVMAFLTFGEGYHNFHHEFQHDYRNGVKPWHFDPTKWAIWALNKVGLASDLRRLPDEKILHAETAERQRRLDERIETSAPAHLTESVLANWNAAKSRLQEAYHHWEQREAEYRRALEKKLEISRERLAELRREWQDARAAFRLSIREWSETHQLILSHFTAPAAA
ncbi:MAG: fatty acid desaturase, partial [Pseudanabaenales cyanobacterium]|nr:fatty acid desaturase [Pseudanabaenales cyanobacterium]